MLLKEGGKQAIYHLGTTSFLGKLQIMSHLDETGRLGFMMANLARYDIVRASDCIMSSSACHPKS